LNLWRGTLILTFCLYIDKVFSHRSRICSFPLEQIIYCMSWVPRYFPVRNFHVQYCLTRNCMILYNNYWWLLQNFVLFVLTKTLYKTRRCTWNYHHKLHLFSLIIGQQIILMVENRDIPQVYEIPIEYNLIGYPDVLCFSTLCHYLMH